MLIVDIILTFAIYLLQISSLEVQPKKLRFLFPLQLKFLQSFPQRQFLQCKKNKNYFWFPFIGQKTCILGIGLDLVKYQVCDTSPFFSLYQKR